MYFRERPDGSRTYIIWYQGTDGKERFENVPGGERDAVRARSRIIDRKARGEKIAPSNLKVKDWAPQWLEERSDIRDKTREAYAISIRCHIVPRLGKYRVCDLSVDHVARFISELRAEGKKAATINMALGVISAMMKTAVRRGKASVNPVPLLERNERPKNDTRKMEILDTDEIQLLLSRVSKTFYPIVATAVFTGLRINELLSLRWEDVDWKAGVLRVKDSKTKAGIREVVLMPGIQKMLAELSLEGQYELVFPTLTGSKHYPDTVRRALKAGLKAAEITKPFRFHDLRHTYASILIHHRHDKAYIAEQMGHANSYITDRVYGHLFDKAKKHEAAREQLEAEFGEILTRASHTFAARAAPSRASSLGKKR